MNIFFNSNQKVNNICIYQLAQPANEYFIKSNQEANKYCLSPQNQEEVNKFLCFIQIRQQQINIYTNSDQLVNYIFLTDKHPSYKAFCIKHNIEQKTFLSKDHINFDDRQVHNQTVNAYIRDFKDFVNKHLKGVSTKYINSYAKWFEFIINTRKKIREIKNIKFNIADDICNNVLADYNGLELYRQSEYSFVNFLKNNGRTNFGNCKKHYYACA